MEKECSRVICLFCCKTLPDDIVQTVGNKRLLQRFLNIVERLLKNKINSDSLKLNNHRFLQCCLNCLDNLQSISNLFHELNCVEMKLEWKLKELVKPIKHTGKNPAGAQWTSKNVLHKSDMRCHDQALSCNHFAKFREDLIQAVSSLQSPYPKVLLNKCDAQTSKSSKNAMDKKPFPTKSTLFQNTADGVSLILVLWLLDMIDTNKDFVKINANCFSKNKFGGEIKFLDGIGFSEKVAVKSENTFDEMISKKECIPTNADFPEAQHNSKSSQFVAAMTIDGCTAQGETPLVYTEFQVKTETKTDSILCNEQIETTNVFQVKFEKTNSSALFGKGSPKSVSNMAKSNGQHQRQKNNRPGRLKKVSRNKMEQNRTAANRYRMKEKMRASQTQSELERLQDVNDGLKVKVEKLSTEIKTIRCLLHEKLQAKSKTFI